MRKIIGRISEKQTLLTAMENDRSELIAVYGRRRVGKTFLIREFYNNELVFDVTGLSEGLMKDQLRNFHKEIDSRTNYENKDLPKTWFDAFEQLEKYLNTKKSKGKKVVFIDEFPWMATPRSKFLIAFENFWNSYCNRREDLIVVICGSAAAYMVKKIIKNKRGLHNRITRKIRLLPFNLKETRDFLRSRSIDYSDYDILQIYMAMGGVPHYLEKLQKGFSVAQNLDQLCFEKDGVLNDEFNQLYASLFDNSERHMKIIRALAKINKGMPRNELILKSGLESGGDFSLKLEELIESGFVSEHPYFQNKKQLKLFRLSDEYSKFYIKFIENNKNGGKGTWIRMHQKQSYKSWSGFAFENLCLKHVLQIKKELRIDAIYSTDNTWYNDNTQIDLLIDRDDNVMNLCEIKFYNAEYTIDKKYYLNLKNKISELRNETKTKKNIFVIMISTFGVLTNKYSHELVQNNLKMESLFAE